MKISELETIGQDGNPTDIHKSYEDIVKVVSRCTCSILKKKLNT